MHLFFSIFFIFISILLIFFILLQPGKGLNNTGYLNIKNNIKFFSDIRNNSFITNIIKVLCFLFLVTSIMLCNINNRKIDSDFFLEDNHKKTTIEKNFLNKKNLNSDIPD